MIGRSRLCAWCRTGLEAAVKAAQALGCLFEQRPLSTPRSAPPGAGRDQAEPWMTKQELAEQLGMSQRWIEKQIHKGMPTQRFGTRPHFKESAVETWLRIEPDGTG